MPSIRPILANPITTHTEAVAFVRGLYTADLLFHFDDSPETIGNLNSGERTFSEEECPLVRQRVEELFGFDFCPFDISIDCINDEHDKGLQNDCMAMYQCLTTGKFRTVKVCQIVGTYTTVLTTDEDINYNFTLRTCSLVALNPEGEKQLELDVGCTAKFIELTAEDDPDMTYTVLEMRGDRMLVQANNGMRLKPTYVVMTAEMRRI